MIHITNVGIVYKTSISEKVCYRNTPYKLNKRYHTRNVFMVKQIKEA